MYNIFLYPNLLLNVNQIYFVISLLDVCLIQSGHNEQTYSTSIEVLK